MNFCKHCGNPLDENTNFCNACDESVSQPEINSNTGFFSKIIFKLESNKTFAVALAILLVISLGIVTFCLLHVLSSSSLKSAQKDKPSNAAGQAGAKCAIIFTDGQDNASLHNAQEVINYAVSSSVPLYIIGAGDVDSYGTHRYCKPHRRTLLEY